MKLKMNTAAFMKDMNNIMEYSYGFLEGIDKGKNIFLNNLGKETINVLGTYIDIEAKANRQALHHVYEWYKTGNASARLFDLKYTVSNNGLSVGSNFIESQSLSHSSNEPFRDKAKIMESGQSITIEPKNAKALAFDIDGEVIFTKNEVVVNRPGGPAVAGSFERIFDEFFQSYFKQSFLKASGIYDYLNKPTLYKSNLKAGKRLGRQAGIETGIRWIANAKVGEVF